ATSALEIRSPAVSSMSISRAGGTGQTCLARSSRSSVVSPIAETTTTTSFPCFLVSTMRSATRRIRSASATEDPPYFCTTSATAILFDLSGFFGPRGVPCALRGAGRKTGYVDRRGDDAGPAVLRTADARSVFDIQ